MTGNQVLNNLAGKMRAIAATKNKIPGYQL